jgi:CheY-like chemotaxis protein
LALVANRERERAVSLPLVLIVDDEPGLLRLFVGLVERLDCKTLQANDGTAALAILERETPDLLILDLAMPEMSGPEVLEYVRSVPRLDSMKVMILTARPNLMPEIVEMGIDYWVSKPVMPKDFIEMVTELLNGG